MHLPPDPFASDELIGAGDPPPDEVPFLAVQRLLAARGVRVPEVLHADVDRRVILLEDLGDRTFRHHLAELSPGDRLDAYGRAVDFLADLHRRTARPGPDLPYRRRFDTSLLRAELADFRRWGVEAAWGDLSDHDASDLDAGLDALAETVGALPLGFVHRDFNSRNIMCAPDGSLVAIDFQDALVGPRPYDLAALLCDSYATLPPRHIRALVRRYAISAGREPDLPELEAGFWATVAQRKLKDAGRFVAIHRLRGNPDFLRWYAPSLAHVGRALARLPSGGGLRAVLTRLVPGFPDRVRTPGASSARVRAAPGSPRE